MGRSYTKDIVAMSQHVDEFVNKDELDKIIPKQRIELIRKLKADIFLHVFPEKNMAWLAKRAGIKWRVGTTNRFYHWFTCNKLVPLSRKKSDLHESQLNLKLLSFLGKTVDIDLRNMSGLYGFTNLPALKPEYRQFIVQGKYNIILHPKSKGSAKEWGIRNFERLIDLLPEKKYNVFVSGTADDAVHLQELLKHYPQVTNLAGKLSLEQFIAFISQCDALVAASTGPLHIAAALGKTAVGLFSPRRPIHPGRWAPVGVNAHVLVKDSCDNCGKSAECNCIQEIKPEEILALLERNERV